MYDSTEQKEHSNYGHVVKYTGLFGGVQGLGMISAILRNKFIAEILGPAGLGLISLYNTAATFISNSTNLGISFSAIRQTSELFSRGDEVALKKHIEAIRLWSLFTAVLGAMVCCVFSPLLSLCYFDNCSDWSSFLWLSPMVAAMALSGGELAILKGVRQLGAVALQALCNSLFSLCISIPLYVVWGEKAILPSLVLMAFLALCTVVFFSFRLYPFTFACGLREAFRQGKGMVGVGAAFIFAGILGSGVELLVRAFMVNTGSEADVGMYNAGYMLTVTYASIVFSAMESDFFPRLSASNADTEASNAIINNQIEASLLIIAPLLVALWVAMPVLLPLFYNEEFMPVIGMAQCALFGMYMRSMALPVSYFSLAKGRSGIYLLAEAVYDVVAVILIVSGYAVGGLTGAGIGLSVAATFDLLLVWTIAHKAFGFIIFNKALKMFFIQFPFGILAFVITNFTHGITYWLLGLLCVAFSGMISVRILLRDTNVLQSLWKKVANRLYRKGE